METTGLYLSSTTCMYFCIGISMGWYAIFVMFWGSSQIVGRTNVSTALSLHKYYNNKQKNMILYKVNEYLDRRTCLNMSNLIAYK